MDPLVARQETGCRGVAECMQHSADSVLCTSSVHAHHAAHEQERTGSQLASWSTARLQPAVHGHTHCTFTTCRVPKWRDDSRNVRPCSFRAQLMARAGRIGVAVAAVVLVGLTAGLLARDGLRLKPRFPGTGTRNSWPGMTHYTPVKRNVTHAHQARSPHCADDGGSRTAAWVATVRGAAGARADPSEPQEQPPQRMIITGRLSCASVPVVQHFEKPV